MLGIYKPEEYENNWPTVHILTQWLNNTSANKGKRGKGEGDVNVKAEDLDSDGDVEMVCRSVCLCRE